jgi:two-component system response regulator AtoC
VRELENVLLEALVRARGSVILLDEIEGILSSSQSVSESGLSTYSLSHMEKEHIRHTLDALAWNRTEVARQLQISLPTLRSKIRKYGLNEPRSLLGKS